ncbi:hypothetical protein RJ639_034215 [Escallonia herrerae]|uniref:Uncharacterized protein n=1 Tax=Escallonia herrerae TaxID=1293975 RepID=A0AA88WYY0_9ASTE|nr:hypothetical protein RJ639_034215 [Escallonia herrerae]
MVDWWWSLVGAAVPVVVASQALRMKKRRAEEQRLKSARGREKSSDDIFVCERVYTSKRMLKKVGVFSKDPTPDTCVTVCGVSELDACVDACARTVCINQHQVPNWNDICLKSPITTDFSPPSSSLSSVDVVLIGFSGGASILSGLVLKGFPVTSAVVASESRVNSSFSLELNHRMKEKRKSERKVRDPTLFPRPKPSPQAPTSTQRSPRRSAITPGATNRCGASTGIPP